MDPMDDIVEPAPPELLTVEEASKVMRIGRQVRVRNGVTPGSRTGWVWDHATVVASKSTGLR